MNDFIVTSAPEKQPNQIIISDDVIAEIRQGIERKDAEEARRLRHLRSLSEHSDLSDAVYERCDIGLLFVFVIRVLRLTFLALCGCLCARLFSPEAPWIRHCSARNQLGTL